MIRILIAGALKSCLFWQISSQTANIFLFYCVKITTQFKWMLSVKKALKTAPANGIDALKIKQYL